ncbi:hypothetical protein DM01DRAFT_1334441 [Hesseltinella vesiculosa]|uniref:Anaphase-promoting complex subunit 4 n=1 Tax=Hesseltinella vesiculosa TaxID=101127 RepID=A0A1X2GLV5_9FUNG|nr:hypothetical protein DM01DRAFT_1334441 [Hesseltinella vesiculosa]
MGITTIWTQPSWKSPIHCISWHPNGQQFAFGCEQGAVHLVDTRLPTPQAEKTWPLFDIPEPSRAAITCIRWIDYIPEHLENSVKAFDPHAFDMEQYLPRLSTTPPPAPLPEPGRRPIQSTLPQEPYPSKDKPSLMLIGDRRGRIHFCVNGSYYIGTVPCATTDGFDKLGATITSIDVTKDLTSIQAVMQMPISKQTVASKLVVLDSRPCKQKNRQVCQMAEIHNKVDYLLAYIQQCIATLCSHHQVVFSLAHNSALRIAALQQDENSDTVPLPHVELLGLLATGNITGETHDYFTNQLTLQQAKRWESRSTHSYAAMQRIIIEFLQPPCTLLLLQLSKLKGYAQWKQRWGDLLSMDTIQRAVQSVQFMLSSLQKLLLSIGVVSKRFEEFIQWVAKVIQRLTDKNPPDYQNDNPGPVYKDPRQLSDYLMNDFTEDSLAAFFVPHDAEPTTGQEPSILCGFEEVQVACRDLLDNSLLTVIKQVQPVHETLVPFEFPVSGRPVASFCLESKDTIHQYYCFIKQDESLCILMRCDWKRMCLDKVNLGFALIQMESGWKVTDMEYFDELELGLLVQFEDADPQQDHAYLLTLPFDDLDYPSLDEWQAVDPYPGMTDVILRYIELQSMKQTIMGTNGRKGRRIMSVAASNCMYRVLEIGDV